MIQQSFNDFAVQGPRMLYDFTIFWKKEYAIEYENAELLTKKFFKKASQIRPIS